jgi:hypothetical protein
MTSIGIILYRTLKIPSEHDQTSQYLRIDRRNALINMQMPAVDHNPSLEHRQ